LKSLDIRQTKVTAEGAEKLQKALPNCIIDRAGTGKKSE
jgi:hypothetical protein